MNFIEYEMNLTRKESHFLVIFYLVIFLMVTVRNVYFQRIDYFFWLCDILPVFLAIAVLIKNTQLTKSIINISLIPHFIFTSDIFFYVLNKSIITLPGGLILGNIGKDLLTLSGFEIFVGIYLHIVPLIVAIWLTYDKRIEFKALIYSILLVMILFFSTITFTNSEINVNFINAPSGAAPPVAQTSIPYYGLIWFLGYFTLIILPTYYLQKYVYGISQRKSK